jgi:hypothetical protein
MITEFVEFAKIPRLSRDMIITEKIDGTNGCIYIADDGPEHPGAEPIFLVGSRSRWITPEADNHGFAKWAYEHRSELMGLGPGRHFGEWWGSGIQRGYGLRGGDKRFSLFNVTRWCLFGSEPQQIPTGDPRQVKMQDVLPACVGIVPVLYRGMFNEGEIHKALDMLLMRGSMAAPGFMDPEGVVIFHVAGNLMFKKTIKGDDVPKGRP